MDEIPPHLQVDESALDNARLIAKAVNEHDSLKTRLAELEATVAELWKEHEAWDNVLTRMADEPKTYSPPHIGEWDNATNQHTANAARKGRA